MHIACAWVFDNKSMRAVCPSENWPFILFVERGETSLSWVFHRILTLVVIYP